MPMLHTCKNQGCGKEFASHIVVGEGECPHCKQGQPLESRKRLREEEVRARGLVFDQIAANPAV